MTSIRENRKKYHTLILDNIEDYMYRKDRYGTDFSLAIAICDPSICMVDFKKNIRQTDKFIQLEDNLCAVVFDGIDYSHANQATVHLQSKFREKNFDKKLYMSIVASDDYKKDAFKMANSLLDVLEFSVANDMRHQVIDDSHL